LQKGFEAMGHRADIVDAWAEDGYKLPAYDYVALAAETLSFFSSKFPERLARFLSEGSGLAGKKGAAFLGKKCLLTNKAILNLMSAMEKEGMVVNRSEVILGDGQAEALAKRIGA
jgi:menaquinone-dependent protoporphyrinogen IX oxidase